ncbi:MAG: electron transfer flavoprotein subunit beta/FixA family protein [Chloroflexi bacterium]|nr:MAG: electron transfer flavoprotein subunit beta/FixA family protein [Chloroflexota bacterium]
MEYLRCSRRKKVGCARSTSPSCWIRQSSASPRRAADRSQIPLARAAHALEVPRRDVPMHLVICAKQIPDPETPPSAFKIDSNAVVPAAGISPVLSPFDAQAAEAALRLKESAGDTKVTVISMGKESAQAAIKQVLAMGADEGVLLNDDAFEGGDSYTTAKVLAAAIRKLGDVDAVFCGRQAADWDMGQVGLGIAEDLGWPCAIVAKDVQLDGSALVVQRVLTDGFETVKEPLPAVVTVSNELGDPRYPKLQQIMQAAKKTVTTWGTGDLGLDASGVGAAGSKLKLVGLAQPQSGGAVQIIEGETPEEQAQGLVQALRDARII